MRGLHHARPATQEAAVMLGVQVNDWALARDEQGAKDLVLSYESSTVPSKPQLFELKMTIKELRELHSAISSYLELAGEVLP